jgi:hypothetical protein
MYLTFGYPELLSWADRAGVGRFVLRRQMHLAIARHA